MKQYLRLRLADYYMDEPMSKVEFETTMNEGMKGLSDWVEKESIHIDVPSTASTLVIAQAVYNEIYVVDVIIKTPIGILLYG